MTHLITLDPETGATVRVPIDLNTGAIDWLRMQPHTEPPSCVRDDDNIKPLKEIAPVCAPRAYRSMDFRIEQVEEIVRLLNRPARKTIMQITGLSRTHVHRIMKAIDER